MDHYGKVINAILEVSNEAGIAVTHRPVSRMAEAAAYVGMDSAADEFRLASARPASPDQVKSNGRLRCRVYG